jgi:uncharacterized Zn-finger protein
MTPGASPVASRKASTGTAPPDKEKEKEKRYKCQFCNRAFSRSEHRSRHERSRKSSPGTYLQAIPPEAGSSTLRALIAWWAGGATTTNSIDFHH